MSKVAHSPQLRFPKFKSDWKESRIGKIYKDLRTGSTPSRAVKSYFKGNNPWITSGELKYNRISTTFEQITDEAIKDTNLVLYQPGTLFIAITGLEAPGTRGKCAINAVPATTNQSCLAFRKVDSVDNVYMFYWYLKYGIPLYFKYAQGTKQQSFNNKIVEKFQIFLPAKPEQQKIAAFLTAVDSKIEQLSKKQELLGEYKRGLMQKIFTQEIRFKTDDGSEFPDWQEKKLGDVVSTPVSDGPHLTPKFVKKGIPFLSVNNLVESKIDFSDVRYISIDDHLVFSKKCKPKKGDVLLGKAASVGKVAFVETDVEFNIWSPIAMIRPSNSNFSKYIYYCFQTRFILNQISKFTNSSSQGNIGMGDISKIIIKLPSKLEQTKIANLLSSIDSKIEQVQKQLDSTKELKKALLQQMFV